MKLFQSDGHRGSIRTAVTNRGDLFFVLCKCGWRSRLARDERDAWDEHGRHLDREVDEVLS
jgi:hypothetical protein